MVYVCTYDDKPTTFGLSGNMKIIRTTLFQRSLALCRRFVLILLRSCEIESLKHNKIGDLLI